MIALKKLLQKLKPASLAAQMILVVLLALIVAQMLSLFILGSAYRTVISDINQKAQFQQVESLIHLLEDSPKEDYKAILTAVRAKGVWFNISESSSINSDAMTTVEKQLAQKMGRQLGEGYQNRTRVVMNRLKGRDSLNRNECRDRGDCFEPKRERYGKNDFFPMHPPRLLSLKASVQMKNGLWLNLKALAPVAPPLAARQTIVFLITSVFFVLVALWVMVRRITHPMRMLANASHRLGRGELVEDLPEKGPADLRDTIKAFNQMNNRLQRFVSDRTRMLAALSHDLRTPITTMRLRVELMDESADKNRLLATLDEMHQMSEATLAFMRQSSDNEPTRKVDLGAMLESLCDDQLELGHDVQFNESDTAIVSCRLVSLKRAIRNLVENAVKYGKRAEVQMQVTEESIYIIIQDSGSGIPNDQLDKVFEPFFRLESSRNRDTGGIGLGMAIARNIIRNHGGEIFLENTHQGLTVKVMLPLG
ncbi:hypothetical protein ACH42_02265 [Endozoicomonas sp. (ex Bugula neritina AB1)]|nr:hypothetical protein ACH42_02265 [Endozoicomonas sp. (ex Bugula neritina AB1)]